MPPVSNVMPLPTRPSTGVPGRALGLVAGDQQPRGFRAAARDSQEQPHPELLHLALVEDLSRHRGHREQRSSSLDELARREMIARLVDQEPRSVDRFADSTAAHERRVSLRRLRGDFDR